MKKVYIYALLEPETKEVRYIGKSVNPKKRFDNHLNIKRKQHCSCWIQSLKIKELKPIFSIIEETDKENWIKREQYWIAFYKNLGAKLTNHTIGGEGQCGIIQSAESNLKRSISLKGRKLGSYSEERKKAISKGKIGKIPWNKGKSGVYSEQTLNKMRNKNLKGSKNPCSKLTDIQVLEIRKRVKDGEKQNSLTKEYKVNAGTINKIVLRKSYSHI